MRNAALVLSGGLSLGAYQAGALEALLDGGAIAPVAVAGSSIGAFHAAMIAGNAPEHRLGRIRAFWARPAQPQAWSGTSMLTSWASVLTTRMTGARGLFRPRSPLDPGEVPSLYVATEAVESTMALIEGDAVRGEQLRCVIACTDVITGETVAFDTADGDTIDVTVLEASGALLPNFAPVRIGGRLLGDGGFSANLPLRPLLDSAPAPLAIAIDLFSPDVRPPRTLMEATARSNDVMFVAQTQTALATLEREWSGGPLDLVHLAYRPRDDEPEPEKPFDFSASRLAARWQAGVEDGRRALALIESLGERQDGGFRLHRVPG
jgi:NTE family protein